MIPLQQIRVGTPCGADWEGMEGTDTVRFCAGCRKRVYNLSAMTHAEAQEALARPDGLPCVRFHHDTAGAPLTREKMPARRRFLGRLAGGLLALVGLALPRPALAARPGAPVQGAPPPALGGVPILMGDVGPPPPKRLRMGKINPPPPPSKRPLLGRVGRAPKPQHKRK